MSENAAPNLDNARRTIESVDRDMAALFVQRMAAVEEIAAWKAKRDLPIFDANREAELIERNASFVDESLRPYYIDFLKGAIDASKRYQGDLIAQRS